MTDMFMEAIKTEQRRIQGFIDLRDPKPAARGHLYLQERGHQLYAYERWQTPGQPERRIYLGPAESDSVQELFSAKFQEQRQLRLQYDQALLQRLARQYKPYDFNSIVSDMPRAYRRVARDNSFEQRYAELKAWAEADCPKNTFPFQKAEVFAEDGTRVRSKGECIWYNLLRERGILFRYDCEIELIDREGNHKKLCPDFLIQCFDGTMIIIEHLGRMGDYKYAVDFGGRCYWYFQDGFVLGKNFFVTSDEPDYGTDSQMIARLADRIEQMFYAF